MGGVGVRLLLRFSFYYALNNGHRYGLESDETQHFNAISAGRRPFIATNHLQFACVNKTLSTKINK